MSLSTPPSEQEDATTTILPTLSQLPITPPLTPKYDPCTTENDVEVVIAHYNEDLSWLFPFFHNCTIYSKGSPAATWLSSTTTQEQEQEQAQFKSLQQLPNIGRETHTYLTHIVRNYHTLAPITFFLQGNIHDTNNGTPAHTELSLSELIDTACTLTHPDTSNPSGVLPIGHHNTFSDWSALTYKPGWVNRRGNDLTRSKFSPGEFWSYIFNEDPPDQIPWVQGALYAVTSSAIHKRPRWFYQRLLQYFESLDDKNPEEGHYMERFWWAVFDGDVAIRKEVSS